MDKYTYVVLEREFNQESKIKSLKELEERIYDEVKGVSKVRSGPIEQGSNEVFAGSRLFDRIPEIQSESDTFLLSVVNGMGSKIRQPKTDTFFLSVISEEGSHDPMEIYALVRRAGCKINRCIEGEIK
jgi:hypothetical protein